MKRDAPAIAQRVALQLSRDAQFEPLVSSDFSRPDFESTLASTAHELWVDDAHGRIRGHLYGATFDDPLFGRQTWTGPDGYSFESDDVLADLCDRAYPDWCRDGSRAHLVGALAGQGTRGWTERGYRVVSVRGAAALTDSHDVPWPEGYSLRQGVSSDIGAALEFDALIDVAQGVDLALLTSEQRRTNEADLIELFEDPECLYYLGEVDAVPVAQCVSFLLPPLRGNFDDTVYLSALAVRPDHQRRGVATRLVRTILHAARAQGARFAEVRWHIDNGPATSLWSALGFRPTYVQLRRPLADLPQG